jgi:hypothetical protein
MLSWHDVYVHDMGFELKLLPLIGNDAHHVRPSVREDL